MTDWTTIIVAGITGAAGFGGASYVYFAARTQARAETERFGTQLAEARREHRQAAYHDFLDSAHRFQLGASGVAWFDDMTFEEWARKYEHDLTAVSLFGTEAVLQKARELTDVIERIRGESPRGRRSPPEIYWTALDDDFRKARDELVRAMRLESAP
jgi:hypothetical protein